MSLKFGYDIVKWYNTQHDEVFDGIEHVQLNPEVIVKAKDTFDATMKTDRGEGKRKNDLLDSISPNCTFCDKFCITILKCCYITSVIPLSLEW